VAAALPFFTSLRSGAGPSAERIEKRWNGRVGTEIKLIFDYKQTIESNKLLLSSFYG
jgi:hypothetical protein